jgi:serine-type D-Ala-D-Ala endopeptidase (penicillin-binding protein 7)
MGREAKYDLKTCVLLGFWVVFVLYYKAMFEKTGRSVRLVSFRDDQPNELRGSLIPRSVQNSKRSKASTFRSAAVFSVTKIALPVVAIMLGAFVSISGYGLVTATEQIAAPTVTIVDPNTFNKVSLGYGPHVAFAQATFFTETRDAFIDEGVTFIEVDFDKNMVRYFKEGVLALNFPIEATGEVGSWWDAPSGLYQVEKKSERNFSNIAQVHLPWSITFEGNYAIHGMPEYPDGTAVPADFSAGGIRVNNSDAEKLFTEVELTIPVLVHKAQPETDTFVYEPTVPELQTEGYLIADIDNNAILAASDLDKQVPIASLTKLMTALVTAEKMDLDSRVQVTSPNFVESLIPRLAERTSVSMYSLLQLLLVESSNEAAEVIAGEYGREAFIKEMNTKATQLGMLHSSFADPSGLRNENTSSLGDLFTLAQYIHKNRTFIFEITAKNKISTLGDTGEFTDLVNFNEVEELDNFVGGKVGETTAAGQTSVTLHTVSIQGTERTVVIILLGSEKRDEDVRTLMKYVEDRYKR